MSRLEIGDDEAWQAAVGVVPQPEEVSADEYVGEVIVPVSDSEEVRITWDVTDGSVRMRHQRDGNIVVTSSAGWQRD